MKEFRCEQMGCRKLLGMVDEDGVLYVDSTRVSEKQTIERGTVVCKNTRGHFMSKEITYKWDKNEHRDKP
jgi:hypothetical protein